MYYSIKMDPYSFDSFFNGDNKYSAEINKLKAIGITDKASWKRWCLENHPDKNKNNNSDTTTADINATVKILIDAKIF
jgi:GH35 family endo-1,4-beta-xylanase